MGKIKVSYYLTEQLEKLGISDFFGLPGDYNFKLIESVEKNPSTNWIGCTNELNAGYAADGYARVKGYGALITTYGVGELSAINAIAGCFAENIPVIKIVGVPATKFIEQNTVLHHNFEHPDYYAFEKAYSSVVETTAYLNKTNAKSEIDRVLSVFVNQKKPVYIAVPVDICDMEIDNNPNFDIAKSDEKNLGAAVSHILELINDSKKPVIIADVLVERFLAVEEAKKFIEKSKIPVTTFLMGKGLIHSDYEGFIGTYLGKYENQSVYEYVNNSDCVMSIGVIYSDLNTFGFDIGFNPSDNIQIFGTYTIVENYKYENILMADVLQALYEQITPKKIAVPQREKTFFVSKSNTDEKLSAKYIFPRFQDFLLPDDIVFSETGIISYGVAAMDLPKGANLYNQVLWGSIGWATPAAFGASIAAKDKRVVLLTGEGSHQLTACEISSIMRYGTKPVIIVLNNDGYTIERLLSDDPMDEFNEIAQWNYSKLPEVFTGDVWTAQARTNNEFDSVLTEAKEQQKTKMCYIEIFADKMDIPDLTKKIIECKLTNKAAKTV